MDREQIAFLNLMARVDGEKPFEHVDDPNDVELGFESIDEAERVFEQTLTLRKALRVQSPAEDIPEEWLERIHSFSDEATRSPKPSLGAVISRKFSDLLGSVQSSPYAWGGGFATACAFIIVVGQPSGDATLESIGGRITSQDPRAVFEALDGDFKNKTSLETEARDGNGSDALNLSNLSTNTAHSGLTGNNVVTGTADDCASQEESEASESVTMNGPEQTNCSGAGESP